MIKIYMRQVIQVMKSNPFMSIISIIGTALAIAMVMCVVIIDKVKNDPLAPEVNRDRSLFVVGITVNFPNASQESNSLLSNKVIEQVIRGIEGAEVVTGYNQLATNYVSLRGTTNGAVANVIVSDHEFFRAFEYDFIYGEPFTEADFKSAINKAVICESTAKRLFGTADVVGKTFNIDFKEYMVCGVVKDVSLLASRSYAEVWYPYTTVTDQTEFIKGIMGMYMCCIVAKDKESFPIIRADLDKRLEEFNKGLDNMRISFHNQPCTTSEVDDILSLGLNRYLEFDNNRREAILFDVLLILVALLVPGINLSSTTQSRMRRRMEEIGVRKVFGATRMDIIKQVLLENLIMTLLGGFFGLLIAYLGVTIISDMVAGAVVVLTAVGGDAMLDMRSMISIDVFVLAFVFCLILNLVSALVPAWLTSKQSVVKALGRQ